MASDSVSGDRGGWAASVGESGTEAGTPLRRQPLVAEGRRRRPPPSPSSPSPERQCLPTAPPPGPPSLGTHAGGGPAQPATQRRRARPHAAGGKRCPRPSSASPHPRPLSPYPPRRFRTVAHRSRQPVWGRRTARPPRQKREADAAAAAAREGVGAGTGAGVGGGDGLGGGDGRGGGGGVTLWDRGWAACGHPPLWTVPPHPVGCLPGHRASQMPRPVAACPRPRGRGHAGGGAGRGQGLTDKTGAGGRAARVEFSGQKNR